MTSPAPNNGSLVNAWNDVIDTAKEVFCINTNVHIKLAFIHSASALVALIYILLLSFYTKPVRSSEKASSRWFSPRNHFGIPVPANFLTNRRPQWIYLVVWACLTATLMGIFTNNFSLTSLLSSQVPDWVGNVLTAVAILNMALSHFPLFAYVYHGGWLNWSLALIQCLLQFLLMAWYFQTAVCHVTHSLVYQVTQQLPMVAGHFGLLIYFLLKIVRSICRRRLSTSQSIRISGNHFKAERNKVMLIHEAIQSVRASLVSRGVEAKKRLVLQNDSTNALPTLQVAELSSSTGCRSRRWIQKLSRYFRIPNLVCCLFVAGLLLMITASLILIEGPDVMHSIRHQVNQQLPRELQRNTTTFDSVHLLGIYVKLQNCTSDQFSTVDCWLEFSEFTTLSLISAIDLGKTTLVLACSLALAINLLQLALILRSFTNKLDALRRGNFDKIIGNMEKYEPNDLIEGSLSYFGYQVAYLVWALILQTIVYWILITSLVLVFYWLRDFVGWLIIVRTLLSYLPITIIGLVVFICQNLLVRCVFLQPPGKKLALRNVRLYLFYQHFANFFNLLVGLLTCIQRILYGTFIGILLLGRLDVAMLPKSFIKFDAGHISFLGFLFTELVQNHPHLRIFILILLTKLEPKRASRLAIGPDPEGAVSSREFEVLKAEIAKPRFLVPLMLDQPIIGVTSSYSSKSAPICRLDEASDDSDGSQTEDKAINQSPSKLIRQPTLGDKRYSPRLVSKWLVAYTLVKNPGLRMTRKSFLRELAKL